MRTNNVPGAVVVFLVFFVFTFFAGISLVALRYEL